MGLLEPNTGEDLDDEIDKLADTDLGEPTENRNGNYLKDTVDWGTPSQTSLDEPCGMRVLSDTSFGGRHRRCGAQFASHE